MVAAFAVESLGLLLGAAIALDVKGVARWLQGRAPTESWYGTVGGIRWTGSVVVTFALLGAGLTLRAAQQRTVQDVGTGFIALGMVSIVTLIIYGNLAYLHWRG